MFDALGSSLRASLRRLTGSGRISAADLEAGLADIRTSLVGADVAMPVVALLLERIGERARASEIVGGLGAGERMLGILHSALTETLGGSGRDLDLRERPATILLLGVQGAGKTTTAAKLAYRLAKDGRRPLLVAADPRRPAAAEQLATLAAAIKVPMHREPLGTPVAEIGTRAIAAARRLGLDVVIIDSSGRTTLDDELLEELRDLRDATKPRERLLVLDAATGQSALAIAEGFKAVAEPTGLILSKLDGDARGGAALSVKEVIGRPIAFASTGEKLDAFEQFHPDRMAGRILGMGDMLTLIEQAEKVFEQDKAEEAAARMLEGQFTLEDFLDQLQQLKKMGPLSGIMGMLPGMPKEMKDAQVGDDQVKTTEAIIRSMTPEERRQPEIINGSRRTRIAKGSGTQVADVNRLIKQFTEMQKMMKRMGGLAKPQGKAGKGKGKVNKRQAMRELGDMLGGQGGMPGFPGLDGSPGVPPFFK